ncbi:hypothetical protein [Thioclava sp. IC9]|uniref:hypothetical protein n=1 Tax=Thioclava sp. IC9 TaxID=1973007 RepID=UPI000B53F1BF|nr:hypothetical protein [Thioclava sp. IC9]OWY03399.1 hypothetical protein B6V76_11225 [Thioclava sp. IC9]
MRNSDLNGANSVTGSDPAAPKEESNDGRRPCPTPGECRLMAGLGLSLAGITLITFGDTGIAGPWAHSVGVSALTTGLLLWGAGAIRRTLEL